MNRQTSFALSLLTMFVIGCGPSQDVEDSRARQQAAHCEGPCDATRLDGRTFVFASAQGFAPVAGTSVRLAFQNGELSVSADCNHQFGAFVLRGGRLIVDSLGSTTKGCERALLDQDAWLSAFLTSRPRLSLEAERLTIRGAKATLAFLEQASADAGVPAPVDAAISQDAALADAGSANPDASCQQAPHCQGPCDASQVDGRTFVFESAQHFEAAAGTTIQLSFSAGQIGISAGCNGQAGPYRLRGEQLIVEYLGSTAKGCERALLDQDAWLADFLTSRPRLSLHGGRLTLAGDKATLRFLERADADAGSPATRPEPCPATNPDGGVGCFGPGRNLDLAYAPDARGCACAAGSQAVCEADSRGRLVALVCERGSWLAVEDGPCRAGP